MNAERMQRCRTLMKAQVYLDGPAALLARAEELGLTDEQKSRLREILNTARQQARETLTEEQRKKLGETPDEPVSMMGMHRGMMRGMMGGRMMGPGGGPGGMKKMCPMMRGPAGEKNPDAEKKSDR